LRRKQIDVLKEASASLSAESARETELVKQLELECSNEAKVKKVARSSAIEFIYL